MKCDELEKFDATSNADLSAGYDHRYAYDADEVDAAIAELKARITDLEGLNHDLCERVTENDGIRQHWEEIEQTRIENERLKAKLVEQDAENRRLKRALWMARAERALAEAEYWYGHPSGMYYIDAMDVPDDEDDPYKRVKDSTIGWYKTWMNVERKCRAMAEKFK